MWNSVACTGSKKHMLSTHRDFLQVRLLLMCLVCLSMLLPGVFLGRKLPMYKSYTCLSLGCALFRGWFAPFMQVHTCRHITICSSCIELVCPHWCTGMCTYSCAKILTCRHCTCVEEVIMRWLYLLTAMCTGLKSYVLLKRLVFKTPFAVSQRRSAFHVLWGVRMAQARGQFSLRKYFFTMKALERLLTLTLPTTLERDIYQNMSCDSTRPGRGTRVACGLDGFERNGENIVLRGRGHHWWEQGPGLKFYFNQAGWYPWDCGQDIPNCCSA
jgi:hypothetical protein